MFHVAQKNIKMSFSSNTFMQVGACILIQLSEANHFINSFGSEDFKSMNENVNAKGKMG